MNQKKDRLEKRKEKKVYFNSYESEMIKSMCKRISLDDSPKSFSKVVRRCAVAVAKNPDLDLLIFAPDKKEELTMEELLLRQKLLERMEENIRILKNHGLDISLTIQHENNEEED